MEAMARIGQAGQDYCYSELCTCKLRHRLWPLGVKGTDDIMKDYFGPPKVGRFIAGVWYPKPA